MNRGNGWELVQLQQAKDGWTWANEKYKEDCPSFEAVAAAESEAKAARRGIWAGSPIAPWEWRSQQKRTSQLGYFCHEQHGSPSPSEQSGSLGLTGAVQPRFS